MVSGSGTKSVAQFNKKDIYENYMRNHLERDSYSQRTFAS